MVDFREKNTTSPSTKAIPCKNSNKTMSPLHDRIKTLSPMQASAERIDKIGILEVDDVPLPQQL